MHNKLKKMSEKKSEHMWTLADGLGICRCLEEDLKEHNMHCGLAGGILMKGYSDKDLDIIVYPHDAAQNRVTEEGVREVLDQYVDEDSWEGIEVGHYDTAGEEDQMEADRPVYESPVGSSPPGQLGVYPTGMGSGCAVVWGVDEAPPPPRQEPLRQIVSWQTVLNNTLRQAGEQKKVYKASIGGKRVDFFLLG